MSIFNFGNKVATRMFVSELSPPPRVMGKGVTSKGVISAIVAEKIIEIAPELIEEGIKLLSSTIANFTEDYMSQTVVYKNLNGDKSETIFLPSHITIVRANFPKDIRDGGCFDDYGDEDNGCRELPDRKLQIDLNIIRSNDGDSFYFQPVSYYYCGRDSGGKKIDELTLSFAFIVANENISNLNDIEFREIINFGDLDSKYEYIFKTDDDRYDTSYQSPWISSKLSKKGAYTIIFKIEERRHSMRFLKIINKIYKKHEDELKRKINREIKEQLTK
jgi:hypothetical protein